MVVLLFVVRVVPQGLKVEETPISFGTRPVDVAICSCPSCVVCVWTDGVAVMNGEMTLGGLLGDS
jgi:hypothetical protein